MSSDREDMGGGWHIDWRESGALLNGPTGANVAWFLPGQGPVNLEKAEDVPTAPLLRFVQAARYGMAEDERPALPEGWERITGPVGDPEYHHRGGAVIRLNYKGRLVLQHGEFDSTRSWDADLLRAFLAECERVRGGGQGEAGGIVCDTVGE